MIKFDKPENLNGTELLAELNAVGIAITEIPTIDGNGDLWLEIPENKKTQAQSIVASHNGTVIPPQPSIEQKLASVGLDLNDLKSALGL